MKKSIKRKKNLFKYNNKIILIFFNDVDETQKTVIII